MKYGIAIGANPSYQDRVNFGRVDMMDKEIRGEDLPGILDLSALTKLNIVMNLERKFTC